MNLQFGDFRFAPTTVDGWNPKQPPEMYQTRRK